MEGTKLTEMLDKKEWLTMKEAQQLLNYSSRNAVYNFCRVYNVQTTKPRGRIYFNYEELKAVLVGQAVQMGV